MKAVLLLHNQLLASLCELSRLHHCDQAAPFILHFTARRATYL